MNKHEELLKYIDIFENDANYGEWRGGIKDKKPNEPMTLPYVKYSKNVMNFIDDVYNIGFMDFSYMTNHEKIKDKPIEGLNLDECKTKLTLFIRGDRFCEGLLLGCMEDGTILKILKRIKELSKEEL